MDKEPLTGDQYHHGNLRAALLDSALVVLTEKGVAGFSMREAARRAGVSQSAPKHHFGDARGLLGALATRAYRQLCDRLESLELAGLDARERVTCIAAEYVAFAGENRALFDLMWRMTQFDFTAPELASRNTAPSAPWIEACAARTPNRRLATPTPHCCRATRSGLSCTGTRPSPWRVQSTAATRIR